MDATDLVARVARAIHRHGLEAVLIGNAAAAMHGAPVTTIDIDFLVRRTRTNKRKLTAIAAEVGGTLYQPFYPLSSVVRMMNDDESMQVDFMSEVSGIRSFDALRSGAVRFRVSAVEVVVANLADVISMKRSADRPRDRAVLEILEKTLEPPSQPAKDQSEWLENDMIRRRVAAPLERRMNFLRRRVGICSTAL